MLVQALERIYILFRFFLIACFKKRFARFLSLLIVLIMFFVLKMKMIYSYAQTGIAFLFLIDALENEILRIILIPIRTTAANLLRKRYIITLLETRSPSYDIREYGEDFAKIKRIPNVVTNMEMEMRILIKTVPIMLKLLTIVCFQSKWCIAILILNLIGTLIFMRNYLPKRIETSKSDNQLGQMIIEAITNHSYTSRSGQNKEDLKNSFDRESDCYESAITYRSAYKALTYITNLIAGFGLQYLLGIDLKQYLILVIKYVEFATSIASIVTMGSLDGISFAELKQHKSKKVDKNLDIFIDKLEIPGIFNQNAFQIKHGLKVTISGPNGAGKTFLCRMIAGYDSGQNVKMQAPQKSLILNPTNSLTEYDIKKLFEIAPEYESVLSKTKISNGYKNFFKILLATKMDLDLIILDETLDLLSDDLLEKAILLLKNIKCSLIVVSHKKLIQQSFDHNLIIKDKQIRWE